MRMFNLADTFFPGTSKRPSLMAEQLGFQHRLGDRPAIDGDEAALASAEITERPRSHLLAGAGFAQNEDIGRRAGDAFQALAKCHHRRRMADQARFPAIGRNREPQAAVFDQQTAMIEGETHRLYQMHRIGGFLENAARQRADFFEIVERRHTLAAGNQCGAAVDMRANGSERLVQLMADAGRHLPNAASFADWTSSSRVCRKRVNARARSVRSSSLPAGICAAGLPSLIAVAA